MITIIKKYLDFRKEVKNYSKWYLHNALILSNLTILQSHWKEKGLNIKKQRRALDYYRPSGVLTQDIKIMVEKHFNYMQQKKCHIYKGEVICFCKFSVIDKLRERDKCKVLFEPDGV